LGLSTCGAKASSEFGITGTFAEANGIVPTSMASNNTNMLSKIFFFTWLTPF